MEIGMAENIFGYFKKKAVLENKLIQGSGDPRKS